MGCISEIQMGTLETLGYSHVTKEIDEDNDQIDYRIDLKELVLAVFQYFPPFSLVPGGVRLSNSIKEIQEGWAGLSEIGNIVRSILTMMGVGLLYLPLDLLTALHTAWKPEMGQGPVLGFYGMRNSQGHLKLRECALTALQYIPLLSILSAFFRLKNALETPGDTLTRIGNSVRAVFTLLGLGILYLPLDLLTAFYDSYKPFLGTGPALGFYRTYGMSGGMNVELVLTWLQYLPLFGIVPGFCRLRNTLAILSKEDPSATVIGNLVRAILTIIGLGIIYLPIDLMMQKCGSRRSYGRISPEGAKQL